MQEFIVSTLEDENDGDHNAGDLSLREAIALANENEGEDSITFDSSLSGGSIGLKTELVQNNNVVVTDGLDITDSVAINGLGTENLTIDGLNSSGIFNIAENIDVGVEGITIANSLRENRVFSRTGAIVVGSDADFTLKDSVIKSSSDTLAGAIYNDGNLSVIDSTIEDSEGFDVYRGIGGAILNNGVANITDSSIINNRSTGIVNEGALSVSNSTLSDNEGSDLVLYASNDDTTISNSTIDGIFLGYAAENSGNVEVTSSIVTNLDKQDRSMLGDINNRPITSGGNNLIGDRGNVESFTDGVNSDIVGTTDSPIDPQLGELQDNGGATPTKELLAGSPAIDTGSNPDGLATDQRGEGFNRTVGDGTDIGAFEVQTTHGGGGTIPDELVVSTLEDENDGDFGAGDLSLREAIALANQQEGADAISFDSNLSGGTIAFAESQERNLEINDSVSINGLGQDNLTLDGGFIFNIANAETDVAIDGLNLAGGKIDSLGNLTLTNSTLSQTLGTGSSDNSSIISRGTTIISHSTIRDNSGGGNVGILVESGTATISNSTVANNQADQAQAGIIVRSDASVDLSNSTVANNKGRSNAGIENDGTVEISNTTIANNNGGLGAGGLINFNDANATVTSSIIANSNLTSTPIGDVSGDGEFISGGNNLIGNGDDATGFIESDIVGTVDNPIDPQLGELQNNGGSTPTQELLAGSPAINTGSNPNGLTTDQRGEGFDRTVGDGTDIGAFEVQTTHGGGGTIPDELVVSTLEDENDGDFGAGDLSLREAIALANQQEGVDAISFDSNLSGGTITLSSGELLIDKSLNIEGLGAENLTIDANDASRVFKINDGDANSQIDVGINGLKITGGNVQNPNLEIPDESRGGGILNQESLTLADTNLTGNKAVEGGGIYNLEARAEIIDSNVNGNSGSGIYNSRSTVNISSSSINENDTGGLNDLSTGINSDSSTVNIVDSTVSYNSSSFAGSGGIGIVNSTMNIKNSSVNNNSTSVFGEAGGIDSDSNSTLRINNSNISNNFGDPGSEFDPKARRAEASGLKTSGTTIITNSTISNNTGVGDGVLNSGNLDVNNTTVSGNAGSGIRTGQGSGTSTISNSTVANNDVGVRSIDADSVTIVSSIVADNNDTDLNTQQGNPVITSGGNNLIGDRGNVETFVDGENGDLVGTSESHIDPQLGELQDNGGATPTQELLDGSPAIDTGSNPNNLTTDQRGDGFNRTVGEGTDIGAFEVQTTHGGGGTIPDELVVSTLEDENDGDFGAGDLSLREAIALSNQSEGEDTITFDSSLSGGAIDLTETEPNGRGGEFNQDLDITDSVNIIGLGANNLTIDGLSGGNGIFKITGENTNVNLEGLTIANGDYTRLFLNDPLPGGAIDFEGDNLTVKDSVIVGSDSTFGGAINNSGNATIINSTITDSSGVDDSFTGGAIYNTGTLDISNSTISNNRSRGVANGGTLEVNNSTISDNSGGGVFNSNSATVTSSIIANNTSSDVIFTTVTPGTNTDDDVTGTKAFTSGGNNLIGVVDGFGSSAFDSPSTAGFVNGENDDLVGTSDNPLDPKLGELQDNGGLTLTQELLEGSPGIDAGSNPNDLATDQRGEGFERTVSNGTDIGAFEVQNIDGNPGGGNLHPGAMPTFGDDTLIGTLCNDLLEGLEGNDILSGGNGNDTFVISLNTGTDTIADFSYGHDLIGLSSEISFADLSFSGNNIIWNSETIATLNGFDTANLTESNFVDV